ncbi:MAG TPA: hypothetical protein VFY39_07200, partial [Gammaproteobacteria bacterium]|nr:hypothetical protein [Gammaproteobacteria bacterium]
LANLILLCSAHHTLLHEGGFTIEKDYRDRWYFRRPDGRAVPACGYRPEDIADDGFEAAEEYFDGNPSAEASTRFRPLAEHRGPNAMRSECRAIGGPTTELYDGPS